MLYRTPYFLHKTKGDGEILFALVNKVWENMQDTKKFMRDKNCVYKCYYENGVEGAVGKMGRGIKWQINCIGLPVVLVGTVTYT